MGFNDWNDNDGLKCHHKLSPAAQKRSPAGPRVVRRRIEIAPKFVPIKQVLSIKLKS